MEDTFDPERMSRRIASVMTLLLFTVGLGVAIWFDRKYERWWKENHPLAGVRRKRERWKAGRQRQLGIASDITQGLAELTTELKRQRG